MPFFSYKNIKISGISTVVPKNVVKTESFKPTFGIDEVEKFIKMTGILETRKTSEFQTASDMAFTAAEALINKKNIDRAEIDALVFGTTSPDYRRPASAFVLQKRLGLNVDTAIFDISLGCSSLLYGLQVVSSMMSNSDIKKAILVVGDTAGKTTNPGDRASVMIIGEASVALLLEKSDNCPKITSLLRSDGNGYRYLIVPGGGYRNLNASHKEEICADGNKRSLHNSFMQGTSVFTFTISDVPKAIKDYLVYTNTEVSDYDYFAFHQANLYILKQIAKKIKIPFEKMVMSIDRFGNTSGASPAVSLCHNFGNERGRSLKIMLCSFGVGLSWGVTSIEINSSDIFSIIEDESVFEEGIIKSVLEV
ncbi:MAG: ketoacyl-ACP synthase III [Mariniphaga sp.]|nr:ketoacyl-ACP synthase III [Mariniphaga sp.]